MGNGRGRRWLVGWILLGLVAGCAQQQASDENAAMPQDFQRFLQWFPGEYDNHEQVWQEAIDKVEHPKERIHHLFLPVTMPALGEHVYFVKQYMDGDPENIYRHRVYVMTWSAERQAVVLSILRFKDEAAYRHADRDIASLAALSADDFSAMPGCEVYWHFQDSYYEGRMDEKACFFHSPRLNKPIYISDTLRLGEDYIWINDQAVDAEGNYVFGAKDGVPHKNRKVSYYSGYAVVARKSLDPAAAEDDYLVIRDLRLHNEGQRLPLLDAGKTTSYEVELARLTYQNSQLPVLVLKLYRQGETAAFSYGWSDSAAARVGLNLRWIQVGLTREN